MGEYRVELLHVAEDDIARMIDYYTAFYPGTAQRRYDELIHKLRGLEAQPYMYAVFEKNPAYRKLISGDYIGLYTVDDERHMVYVYRILPGKLDIAALLTENSEQGG